MPKQRCNRESMNDEVRHQWVLNDEGLYNWWRMSKQPIRAFIRSNRSDITSVIENVTSGRRRAHYLVYG